MTKHMLIDATHAEETRVVVMDGRHIDDYDVESSSRRQLKGNIYLAKVIRIEPSLQAAFVDYGGNRHGFLAFSEIHPDYFQIPVADREKLLALQEEETRQEQLNSFPEETTYQDDRPYEEEDESPEMVSGEHDTGDEDTLSRRTSRFLRNYRIQEVIRRRQIILVQVVKEERGNKGAALTTYISLAGRYCVLMPNALRGGGVSRKITSDTDRKRLKEIVSQLELPNSMAMIIRTAGAGRPEQEIIKDCDYLLQLWDDIRAHALSSIAPVLVYEEATLIKRAIRDLFSRDIEDIYVDGEKAWKSARDFARLVLPHNARKIKLWQNRGQTLFSYYNVETALDAMYSPIAQLESGGYLVINQTEALVSIDVNSGKSTSQRNIEETAVRTNLEAADEIARQLRFRDLAGLIVIDFIDMENRRHNIQVERRLKDALKQDRARIQVGHISHFGLLEMSRQRLHPSLAETMLTTCPHCHGMGTIRGTESNALHVLRSIEEEAARHQNNVLCVTTLPDIALYMLNAKRDWLNMIENQHNVAITFKTDETLGENFVGSKVKIEWSEIPYREKVIADNKNFPRPSSPEKIRTIEIMEGEMPPAISDPVIQEEEMVSEVSGEQNGRRRRRRNGRRHNQFQDSQEKTFSPTSHNETEDAVPVALQSNEPQLPASSPVSDAEEELVPGRRRTRTRRLNNPRRERRNDAGRNESTFTQPAGDIAYQGPTPADPFGGFDIFEVIEQHDDQALMDAKTSDQPEEISPKPVEEKKPARRRQSDRSTRTSKTKEPQQEVVLPSDEVTDQEATSKEDSKPVKPARRRATSPAKRKKTQTPEASETVSSETPPSEEVKKTPTRKRRSTSTRQKKTETAEAKTSESALPALEENSAAPQPIDVDEARPSKRRVGWWKR